MHRLGSITIFWPMVSIRKARSLLAFTKSGGKSDCFQGDRTKFENQIICWCLQKCSADTDLDRDMCKFDTSIHQI